MLKAEAGRRIGTTKYSKYTKRKREDLISQVTPTTAAPVYGGSNLRKIG
jgi:hypothetical protein